MTNIRNPSISHVSLDRDFKDVAKFLKIRKILPNNVPIDQLTIAKKMHVCSYSLILWRFLLQEVPDHGMVFINEIASDALQVLPQALFGYRKTVDLLIRGIIENLIRHIYFIHHPIEFKRANLEKKWYITNELLFEYLRNHPEFIAYEKKFDAINRLKTLYDVLSGDIHGRKVNSLEMHNALKEIKFNQNEFYRLYKSMKICCESSNFLLLLFHADAIRGFPEEPKSIIKKTISRKERRILIGLI